MQYYDLTVCEFEYADRWRKIIWLELRRSIGGWEVKILACL